MRYQADMAAKGFRVETTADPAVIGETCSLIVTATASEAPILPAGCVRPGTHITAIGADTVAKQELDPEILARADLVVADSIAQCLERGEIHHALERGLLARAKLIELGQAIADTARRRRSDREITVCCLTGVAVQDIQIAKAVLRALQPTQRRD